MSRAVKAGVLGLVIVATVWALTLWRWRRAPEAVSGQDMLVYLVAVPMALTAVAFLAWRAVHRLRAMADRPVTALADASPAPADAGIANPATASAAIPAQPMATVLAEALTLARNSFEASFVDAAQKARWQAQLDVCLLAHRPASLS